MGDHAIHLQTTASWQVFFSFIFSLPEKKRPRMLMPCKYRREAKLKCALLFWWALLKNPIKVLKHRFKKNKNIVLCFLSPHDMKSFPLFWKEGISQVLLVSSWHKRNSITLLSLGWILSWVCVCRVYNNGTSARIIQGTWIPVHLVWGSWDCLN